MRIPAAACALGVLVATVLGGQARRWPPEGEARRVPVSRDTWVSSVGREAECNLGGATRLKTKAYQEFSVVDFDPAPLRGRVVTGAVLHLHGASKAIQKRLSVSSLASPWVEGTSPRYQRQAGSSCFDEAESGRRSWAYPGSDITAVMMGEGHTAWATWDATPPDDGGWQTVAVDPRVVAARVAGISHGFVVFDDTGSEWTRRGEHFEVHIFPNRFVHSRESGEATAPYFTLYLGERDEQPPGAPAGIRSEEAALPAGQALLSWATPADAGPAGTVGFFVRLARGDDFAWQTASPVPRYLVPMAGRPGERVTLRLRDAGLEAGETMTVGVRAVDGAGNVGPVAVATTAVSARRPAAELGGAPAAKFAGQGALPAIGGVEVFVVDPLDKVQPVTGAMIPEHPPAYLAANHLWSAERRRVRLCAARNEFVAFQLVLRGQAREVNWALALPLAGGKQPAGTVHELRYVKSKRGPLPDPLVPLRGPMAVPSAKEAPEGQRHAAFLVDVYVPHGFPAGRHQGVLALSAGGEKLTVALELEVWDFTLPDYLSFVPEMNSYGLPAPPAERGYYRLAHAHRTCLNRLPYSQSGSVDYAPRWDGERLEWTAWDAHFGPYLDGSAFADLPRSGVPLDTFYLPLHENWPSSVFENYNGSYWADRAFPPAYRRAFVGAARQIARHVEAKGWHDTHFQCYLNNKSSYKRRGWSRGSSPWLLDEPASFQDFWALRWFATAFHEGVAPARDKARIGYRIDISRPQWERDFLEDVVDYYVCGGAFRRYRRMVLDRQRRNGMLIWEYGSSNAIEESNVQPAAWCLSAWCLGADGVLPWQTIGREASWTTADTLSLFYPGGAVGRRESLPSVRLKAYRRGQQDVEYLVLLARELGAPRWAVGRAARQALRLAGSARKGPDREGAEDAGTIAFRELSPVALWELRTRLGRRLSEAAPPPRRRLVDLRTPVRQPRPVEAFLPSPRPPSAEARRAEARRGPAVLVQGKPAVADALITFEHPDHNFGDVPRDNRLRRMDRSNAFLVRFDLRGKLPERAQVLSAEVSFCVWDPSSRGRSRVCAFRIRSVPWDEGAATWRRAAADTPWKGEGGFQLGVDTAKEPDGHVIVPPDQGPDTVSPPLEYAIDVTPSVRAWVAGEAPNCGLAIVAVADRTVDEGQWTRMQLLASEYARRQFTPKLT
ncbi:MAG: DNRLRE domain-containing protein, partial [Candidatus Brocadiia bacterium]